MITLLNHAGSFTKKSRLCRQRNVSVLSQLLSLSQEPTIQLQHSLFPKAHAQIGKKHSRFTLSSPSLPPKHEETEQSEEYATKTIIKSTPFPYTPSHPLAPYIHHTIQNPQTSTEYDETCSHSTTHNKIDTNFSVAFLGTTGAGGRPNAKRAPTSTALRILGQPERIHALSNCSSFANALPPTGIPSITSSKSTARSTFSSLARRSTLLRNTILDSNEEILKESVQKLTIEQLKEQIKELGVPVEMSQLKLKADCVNFLLESYSNQSAPLDVSEQEEVVPPTKRRKPRSMPPLQSSETDPSPTGTDDDNANQTPASSKDLIFEYVMRRYPPLQKIQKSIELQEEGNDVDDDLSAHMQPNFYRKFTGLGEMDVRQKYHPMLKNTTLSDLDIITVGTASCVPGTTRGVSCTALRLQWRRNGGNTDKKGGEALKPNMPTTGGIWIFDCGESTQLQIQRTRSIRPGKISKIFITHAHGDHSFGLPGLLCIMGQDRDRDGPPLEIYGPEGLRMWLRTCIRYTVSRIVPPYRVHELMDIPMAPEWSQGSYKNGRYFYQLGKRGQGNDQKRYWGTQGLAGQDPVSWITRAPMINLEPSTQFGEIEGGRDIYPLYNHPKCVDGAPIWEVEDEGDVKVHAAPMSHGVPCVGYVVEEENKPGRLKSELVEPIAKRNVKALRESGMKIPMKIMATIKDLPAGGSYTFPDGTVIRQEDVVEPIRKGRKVVVCGDTADSRAISSLAQGADVLIHEATNAFLIGIDKDRNKEDVARDARIHGHSTPGIAGEFAKEIGAKKLVLNHFSSRYKGDQSLESISIMTRIEQEAVKASGLSPNNVAAAWDFMILPVPQED